MTKKFIGIAIVVLLMFTLFGLYACSDATIADYKETAKAEITAHIIGLKQSDYSAENWMRIEQLANEGRTAISDATSKGQVDRAKTAAITAINEVSSKKVNMELSADLESQIKADFLQEFGYELNFGNEYLNKFYGLYNGAAVFFIAEFDAWIKTVQISGVTFSYKSDWTIWVWSNGIFYNLENVQDIIDAGIISQSDIENIGILHAIANTE